MSSCGTRNGYEDAESLTSSPELEALRNRILEIEYRLGKFGLDPRRGVESYSIGELRSLFERVQGREELRSLLLTIVELQEELYRKLYEMAGLKEMNVDTDIPEKRLATIKKWLLAESADKAPRGSKESKKSIAIKMLAEKIASIEDDKACAKEIEMALTRIYKRDYDRCQVLKTILSKCIEAGALKGDLARSGETSLVEAVSLLLRLRRVLGKKHLKALIMSGER